MNTDDDGLADIMHSIITSTSGINRVILADKTGLTLAHTSRFDMNDVDIDGLGAITSAVYMGSEQQGLNVGLKNMTGVIAEFKNGNIMIASNENVVLSVFTDKEVAIGMVRMIIREAISKIGEIVRKRMELYEEEIIEPAEIPTEPQPTEKPVTEEKPPEDDEALLSDLESALKELEFF